MKKLIYGTLFLAVVGVGFTSCEKEDITENTKIENSSIIGTRSSVSPEIRYMPETIEIANQLVIDFKSNTMTGNSDLNDYINNENDPTPEKGIWIMEATANYLTNKYIAHTSSDEVIQISLSVRNYVSTNEIVKMDDVDMYRKFDQVFSNINSRTNGTNQRALALDFKVLSINEIETVLQVFVVVGTPILPTATWPTTNGSVYESADELESKLNSNFFEQLLLQNYPQYTTGNLYTSTWVTNGPDFYFSNVNFLNQNIDPIASPDDLSAYGCPTNDCLWGNIATGVNVSIIHPVYIPNASNLRLFPATEYPTYYNRGELLIQNNYAQTTQVSNALGVFSCKYNVNGIISSGSTADWHYIEDIYAGIFHSM